MSGCLATVSGPMSCVGDDDVERNAIVGEMSQSVFTACPLVAIRGYIIQPIKVNSVSAVSASEQFRLRVVQLAGEDLSCAWKTLSVP
jgi:hypothetical protein